MALIKCEVCEKENVEESQKKGVCVDCYKEIADKIKKKNNVLSALKEDEQKEETSRQTIQKIQQTSKGKTFTNNIALWTYNFVWIAITLGIISALICGCIYESLFVRINIFIFWFSFCWCFKNCCRNYPTFRRYKK